MLILRCLLSGGTQRRALPRPQSEELKILNISFPRVGIEPTKCRVVAVTLVHPAPRLSSDTDYYYYKSILFKKKYFIIKYKRISFKDYKI